MSDVYFEHISLPLPYRVGAALAGSAIAAGIVLPPAYGFLLMGWFESALCTIVIGVLVYAVVGITVGTKVRIRNRKNLSGEYIDILEIRGTQKGDRPLIPCRDINDVRVVQYQPGGLRGFFLGAAVTDYDEGGYAMQQTGYQGTGLAISYTYKPIFGQETKRGQLQFPTTKPRQLAAKLGFPLES